MKAKGMKKSNEDTVRGYEIVCPDAKVRHYPYTNLGDAEAMASRATRKSCRIWPNPSPLELSLPPCPGGEHKVASLASKPECKAN